MLDKFLGKVTKPPPEETSDVIARIWQAWKAEHPGATIRDFWAAVAAGEVVMPDS